MRDSAGFCAVPHFAGPMQALKIIISLQASKSGCEKRDIIGLITISGGLIKILHKHDPVISWKSYVIKELITCFRPCTPTKNPTTFRYLLLVRVSVLICVLVSYNIKLDLIAH